MGRSAAAVALTPVTAFAPAWTADASPGGSAGGTPAVSCPATPEADVSTPQGYPAWVAEHPDQVAVVLDDGQGP